MGRLVDVDALIEKIQEEKKKNNYSDVTLQVVNLFIEMLDEQPTAYDVEMVVEQIHEELFVFDIPTTICDDIVKRGGVDGC